MGLFSIFKKNKQESTINQSHKDFYSTSENESVADRARSGRRRGTAGEADPMLPEKKRARRRLIGAVALVLAAVIILPMVLDPEPKTQTDSISVQIPSKDKAGGLDPAEEIVEAPSAPSSPAKMVANPESLSASETVAEDVNADNHQTEKKSNTSPVPAIINKTETPAKSEVKSNAPAVAEKKTEKNNAAVTPAENKPAVEMKSAEAKPADHDAARAMAILEGRTASKASGGDAGNKFVIQVAALATQDKVDELRAKLKDANITSYTQKVATSTGEKIRVRVGPFSSKSEADKMHAKLSLLGLNGTLIPVESH